MESWPEKNLELQSRSLQVPLIVIPESSLNELTASGSSTITCLSNLGVTCAGPGACSFSSCAAFQPPSYSIIFSSFIPLSPRHSHLSLEIAEVVQNQHLCSVQSVPHRRSCLSTHDAFSIDDAQTIDPFVFKKPHLFPDSRDLHWLNGHSPPSSSSPSRRFRTSPAILYLIISLTHSRPPTLPLFLRFKRYLDSSTEHCFDLQNPVWLVSFIW